jgi:hypothetical protein
MLYKKLKKCTSYIAGGVFFIRRYWVINVIMAISILVISFFIIIYGTNKAVQNMNSAYLSSYSTSDTYFNQDNVNNSFNRIEIPLLVNAERKSDNTYSFTIINNEFIFDITKIISIMNTIKNEFFSNIK